jgi:hypothetical protein
MRVAEGKGIARILSAQAGVLSSVRFKKVPDVVGPGRVFFSP